MAGDTHGNLVHCQYLVRTAKDKKLDRVLQLGDFGYWPHMDAGIQFLDRLDQFCNILGITFYWVDGNHDKSSMIDELYRLEDGSFDPDCLDPEGFVKVRKFIRYAPRGHRWTWDGCRFIALGGAYSIDKDMRLKEEHWKGENSKWTVAGYRSFAGTYWFPEEEMTDEDMAEILAGDSSPVDVIVAHDKPLAANPGWNRKDYPECLPNQQRLQLAVNTLDPTFFFHGHLHFPYRDIMLHSYVGGDEPHATAVMGLDCDEEAGQGGFHQYRKEDSWYVFDTSIVPASRDIESFIDLEASFNMGPVRKTGRTRRK